jgi:hypothetical protein
MHYLAIFIQGLLRFFMQPVAVRQQSIAARRNNRRDAPVPSAPLAREPGFGWMNVASVYEPRREPPKWSGIPGVLDDRPTRRGG